MIAALIATCSGFLLYNTYADFEAKEKNNYFHRHLIDRNFILTRRNVSEGRWWTGVTYSLMHFNLLHLGLNMVPLWSFGPGILRLIGLPAFGGLWLGSSITAAGATFVGDEWKRAKPNSSEVRDERKFMGASASLLGICTTTAYVFPTTTVALIPIPFPIQIRSAMVGFAAFSVMAYVSDALPFLGHSGHLGGMAFGALYSIVAFRGKAFIPRS